MKTKQYLSLFATLFLLVSLAACGKSNQDTTEKTTSETQTTVVEKTDETTEAASKDGVETGEIKLDGQTAVITIPKYDTFHDFGNQKVTVQVDISLKTEPQYLMNIQSTEPKFSLNVQVKESNQTAQYWSDTLGKNLTDEETFEEVTIAGYKGYLKKFISKSSVRLVHHYFLTYPADKGDVTVVLYMEQWDSKDETTMNTLAEGVMKAIKVEKK